MKKPVFEGVATALVTPFRVILPAVLDFTDRRLRARKGQKAGSHVPVGDRDAETLRRDGRGCGAYDAVALNVPPELERIRELEERYARLECPVVSNNSAHRWTEDVPMVVPEINAEHLAVIEAQRKRLGTKRGFIAVKSNCSLQSYVPALSPLRSFGIEKILTCTYQAISGAGKTFQRWPEMVDNCIPYIGGEEEKSEIEPLKILWSFVWGRLSSSK